MKQKRYERERDIHLFDAAMLDLYPRTLQASKEAGSRLSATRFLQGCYHNGGYKYARIRLASNQNMGWLETLQNLGLVHLSLEALVLDERFSHLFSTWELKIARERIGDDHV